MSFGEPKQFWGTKQIVITGLAFLMVLAGSAYIMSGSTTSLGRVGEKLNPDEEKFRLRTPELSGTMEGVVGADIGQGRYRNTNSKPGCNWLRMEIGKDTRKGAGEGVFEIELSTDLVVFQTNDCDPWHLITDQ